MKKNTPYIIAAVVFLVLATMLVTSARNPLRRFNETITLRQKDKIPYGTYVAYHLLPSLFPHARVTYEKKEPDSIKSLQREGGGQALILVAKNFDAGTSELNSLLEFVQQGNYVFIIARYLSSDASKFFKVSDNGNYFEYEEDDSLQLVLHTPPFAVPGAFVYPGKKYESYFSFLDQKRARVLGHSKGATANFIQMKSGRGSLFIHLAPLAFSNYFILHKNNIEYFKSTLSVIPENVRTVVWDDYYLMRPGYQKEKDPSILRVLLSYPSFKWALLTALGTLLLLVLLEMRRKQRIIPVWERPKNESLDFVRTIGRLYYERGDHKNLVKKMSAYFLEHIRSRYQLPTHTIDTAFAESLHAKTGYPLIELKRIVRFMEMAETAPEVSEYDLSHFYQQLESFYQNTADGRTT
ncbi:DUF4350 domain-containing protein [Paraflavisolibacter sp. H34]|uniref:DUF4350 domain-containing protein n=1 Tax=Huijunlia imazamoxiresistens TaxID=3127457 RepID=UPI0030191BDD